MELYVNSQSVRRKFVDTAWSKLVTRQQGDNTGRVANATIISWDVFKNLSQDNSFCKWIFFMANVFSP